MSTIRLLRDEPDTRRLLRRVWPYVRHERNAFSALGLSTLNSAVVVSVAPLVGLATSALADRDRGRLWLAVWLLLGSVVAHQVLMRAAEVALATAGERVVRTLRERAVENVARAPLRFLEQHRSGDLLRRTTSEIAELADFVRISLPNLVTAVGTLLFTLVTLFLYSWLLTLVVLVLFLPLAIPIVRGYQRVAGSAFAGKATAEGTVAATFAETLAARETLQTLGGLPIWLTRFRHENAVAVKAARKAMRAENRIVGVSLVEGVTLAGSLAVAVWLATDGRIGLDTVVVFALASRGLVDSFGYIAELVGETQAARTGLSRLLDLLDATDGLPVAVAGAPVPERGALVAEAVSFGYASAEGSAATDVPRDVLRDVTLELRAGARVALVGETGCGKTTLAKLLTGLYAPNAGRVTFAGVDVSTLPAAELRSRIILIPQEVSLITGTVAENLALIPRVPSAADMQAAVDRIGLRGWVDDLPDGLDTSVGARGSKLSAGERQVIGLLRAALLEPAVLVLDEATADVDPVTAGRIEHALDELDCTVVVVAHRPATIARLPERYTIVDGRLMRLELAS